jgi:hypothetical protein
MAEAMASCTWSSAPALSEPRKRTYARNSNRELVPQMRTPVCGDHRENFGWPCFGFVTVDRSDGTIGEVVHEGKESGC